MNKTYEAMGFKCPTCEAQEFERCRTTTGMKQERVRPHKERLALAREQRAKVALYDETMRTP